MFLHALLFFLFGTLVATLPVPGLTYGQGALEDPSTIGLPQMILPHHAPIHCNIPDNAVGFWQRDPDETKVSSCLL